MDSGGNITAVNTFGAQGLLSRHTATGSMFYTFDPQGSVVQRLSGSQAVLSTSLFDAFGNALTTGAGEPWGYGAQAGYYTDTETGLVLCTHRYYDPSQGRWLYRDPIGFGGGINLYGYVGNGPVDHADPLGADQITIGIGGLGGAGYGLWSDANFIIQFPTPWNRSPFDIGCNAHVGGGFVAGMGGNMGAQMGWSPLGAPIQTGSDNGMDVGGWIAAGVDVGGNYTWNPFDDPNGDINSGFFKGSGSGSCPGLNQLFKPISARIGVGIGGGVNMGAHVGWQWSLKSCMINAWNKLKSYF